MWIKSDGTIVNLDNVFEIYKACNSLTSKETILRVVRDEKAYSDMEFQDQDARDKVFDKIKYLLQNTTTKFFDADIYLDEITPKSKPELISEPLEPELISEPKNPNILC